MKNKEREKNPRQNLPEGKYSTFCVAQTVNKKKKSKERKTNKEGEREKGRDILYDK